MNLGLPPLICRYDLRCLSGGNPRTKIGCPFFVWLRHECDDVDGFTLSDRISYDMLERAVRSVHNEWRIYVSYLVLSVILNVTGCQNREK